MGDIEQIALGGGEALNYGDVQDDEPTHDDEVMHGLIAGAADSDDDEPRHTRKRHRKQDNVAYEDAEDTATHQGLCCQLCRFHTNDRFGPYLSTLGFKLTPTALRQLDIEQLTDLKQRVVTSCMNRGSSSFMSGAVFGLTQAAETICAKTKLGEHVYLQGLTESLRRDENFVDMVTLFDLTTDVAKGSPSLLLLYAMLSNIGKVHSVNKFLKMRQQMAMQNNVEEGKENDVNDHPPRHDRKDGD